MRADHEGIEPVEILQAVFQRALQRVAGAQARRQIGRGHFAVIVGLEALAVARELLAQAIVVRE